MKQKFNTGQDLLNYLKKHEFIERNQGLNFLSIYYEKPLNTIEVRCPNGSLNPVIWQNNINFLLHLFNYAASCNFDEDIVNYVKEKSKNINNISMYNRIYEEDAIILANLIFKEEIDKLYFLRQYIKDGKENGEFVKSISFTKKY